MQNKSILDKPVGGTPVDIADAIAKKHTQNTDTILNDGGANEIAVTELVRKVTGDITYYVATDGNDTTGDGTTEFPFATIQHAIDLVPKYLNDYYVSILLKDGTYPEGEIAIRGFVGGWLDIYSASWNVDSVLIAAPADKANVFVVNNNSAYIMIDGAKLRVQKNNGICIDCQNNTFVDVYWVKLGDNDNANTYGIVAWGGNVSLRNITDIDAKKVSIGIKADFGSLVTLYDTAFGDTFTDVTYGGLITDGIVLNKTDYDSAVSLKHTQGADITLGTMTADIDMNNSYQVVNLQAPDANGQAIRATTKITEALLETIQDTYMNQPKTMARSLFR